MLTFKDEELRTKLQQQTGEFTDTPTRFHAFTDVEQNVRQQIEKVKEHPWVPRQIPVRGFIYDVRSGMLSEVFAAHGQTANG